MLQFYPKGMRKEIARYDEFIRKLTTRLIESTDENDILFIIEDIMDKVGEEFVLRDGSLIRFSEESLEFLVRCVMSAGDKAPESDKKEYKEIAEVVGGVLYLRLGA